MSEQESVNLESKDQLGVLGYREEFNHYIVKVRWKDGIETELHFPIAGFIVVNPETNEVIRKNLPGKEAVSLLERYAKEYDHGDFSWRKVFSRKGS